MASNLSLCVIGKTTASLNSSIYLSNPPISVYSSYGLSSTSIALTKFIIIIFLIYYFNIYLKIFFIIKM